MTTEKIEKLISLRDCKQAFAVPGEDNIIDLVHPITGHGVYSNETLEEIGIRYPGAEVVNFDDWMKAKAAKQDCPVTWAETTEAKYWEMLEVLPPAFHNDFGFLVGEPWDHHATSGAPRFAAYRQKDGKFFVASRPMTRREFAQIAGYSSCNYVS